MARKSEMSEILMRVVMWSISHERMRLLAICPSVSTTCAMRIMTTNERLLVPDTRIDDRLGQERKNQPSTAAIQHRKAELEQVGFVRPQIAQHRAKFSRLSSSPFSA